MTYGKRILSTYDSRPIPPRGNGRERLYPLDTMNVKHSFSVPRARGASLRSVVWRENKKKSGKHFIVRTIKSRAWCWRTQ